MLRLEIDGLFQGSPALWLTNHQYSRHQASSARSYRSFERCMGGSGIRSAMGAVVGLSGRWEAGNLLQRACGAFGLRDWTVACLGFYTDPVSPAALSRLFTGNLLGWRRPMVCD